MPLPRRPAFRLLALGLVLTPALAVASPAQAAACPPPRQGPANVTAATQTSASSSVGTPNTMTVTVLIGSGAPAANYCVTFVQNAGPSVGWPRSAFTDDTGHAFVTWTSATTGSDSITAFATNANGSPGQSQTLRHTWTPKPKPTPTPKPSPTPSASPSPSPAPQPTTPPAVIPTGPAATNPPPPATTTPPTPPPAKSPTPSAPPPVPSPTGFSGSTVALDRPSALPGGSATLTGRNCPPGASVAYTVAGLVGGQTLAGPDGTFTGQVQLPDAPIGEYPITVVCGGQSATVPIDLVVSSAVTSGPAGAITAAAVLVFFVLLGSVLYARTSGTTSVPEPLPDAGDTVG